MNIVVSIGGSVLSPDDPTRIAKHADVLTSLAESGHQVAAVVGGGSPARTYIETARELGSNEMKLDEIGIAATRLNARLLIAALGDKAVQTPPTSYEEASSGLQRGKIVVMGGVVPAQTTDAVGAALAEYINADLLVYATSVDGVYTADPRETEDAEYISKLSASELIDIIVDIEMNAGAGAPVDLLAAKILQRSGLRAIVLDGTDPANIEQAVQSGEHTGTEIIPE